MNGILIIVVLAVLGGLAAVWLVGLLQRSSGSANARQTGWSRSTRQSRLLGSTTRSVEDGFWIDTDGYDDGDELHYRVFADGRWHDHQVIVESASPEQFIYTGTRPEQVVFRDSAGGTRHRTPGPSADDDRPLFESRRTRDDGNDDQPVRRSAPIQAERDDAPTPSRGSFSATTPEAEPEYRSAAEHDEPSSATTPEAAPEYRSAADSPAAY